MSNEEQNGNFAKPMLSAVASLEYDKPSQESIDKYERAFNARLAYEKNCIAKYDYQDNIPSKPPIKGERMEDFACRFGTTIQEMKECLPAVERALNNGL